jgi:hypothetical protein
MGNRCLPTPGLLATWDSDVGKNISSHSATNFFEGWDSLLLGGPSNELLLIMPARRCVHTPAPNWGGQLWAIVAYIPSERSAAERGPGT